MNFAQVLETWESRAKWIGHKPGLVSATTGAPFSAQCGLPGPYLAASKFLPTCHLCHGSPWWFASDAHSSGDLIRPAGVTDPMAIGEVVEVVNGSNWLKTWWPSVAREFYLTPEDVRSVNATTAEVHQYEYKPKLTGLSAWLPTPTPTFTKLDELSYAIYLTKKL